jgi:hypothetical protein
MDVRRWENDNGQREPMEPVDWVIGVGVVLAFAVVVALLNWLIEGQIG